MKNGPFGFIPPEKEISVQNIQKELENFKKGIDNTILVLKQNNKIEYLKDKDNLIKKLNIESIFIGKDIILQNVIDVKKLVKDAKSKLTKKMQETELYIYTDRYYSKQEINEILNPTIFYLEKRWKQEEKEIKTMEKNIEDFVNGLSEKYKEMIKESMRKKR